MLVRSMGRLAFGVVPFGGAPPVGDAAGPGLIITAIPSKGPAGIVPCIGLFIADPAMAPTTIKVRLRFVCVNQDVVLNNKALEPHGSDAHEDQSVDAYHR